MPVYVAVEVSRREFAGRLLLGLVAAERGYDVVLGKIPHKALLAGELNGWLMPPGILHQKSCAASSVIYDRLDRLRSQGMRVTVQDEEHGLTVSADYGKFAESRFPPEGVARVDRIMAWGPVDEAWLSADYPRPESLVVGTGSPRIDLWRPEVIGSAQAPEAPRNFVLFAASTSPFGHNPFWVQIYNSRNGLFGPAFRGNFDENEFEMYDDYASAVIGLKYTIKAVRKLSENFPHLTIVFRPHHFEVSEVWEALIGELPNVVIRSDGESRSWVNSAAITIQSSSTLAIEAAVANHRVVSFMPVARRQSHPVDRLGIEVSSVDELVEAVEKALCAENLAGEHGRDLEFLHNHLYATSGRLAADRIVDEWEELLCPRMDARIRPPKHQAASEKWLRLPVAWGRHVLRGARDFASRTLKSPISEPKGRFPMAVRHKFPSLDIDAVRADAARLSDHLGRFNNIEIIQIGEREVLLRAAGR